MALHVVFGCNGPLGVELMHQLSARGHAVRGVSRSGRSERPPGAEIVAGDAADAPAAARLAAGASVVHSCIGLPYPEWEAAWPRIVEGLLSATAAAGARLVFADNVYAYGPPDGPLHENLPPTTYGRKPALRARLATMLLDADRSGRVPVALVRASDFYGPRVRNALLGDGVFKRVLEGKPAQVLGDIDQPHTYAYVPDYARAMVTIAESDDGFGEAWHVPSAPAIPTRAVVEQVFGLAGGRPRIQVMSKPLWSVVRFVSPMFRELWELRYQWDRPFVVDHTKFAQRFWGDYTPLDVGLKTTLEWYRAA